MVVKNTGSTLKRLYPFVSNPVFPVALLMLLMQFGLACGREQMKGWGTNMTCLAYKETVSLSQQGGNVVSS